MKPAICDTFKQEMSQKYGRELIFCRGDTTFSTKQQIFNARFNYKEKDDQPILIAECETANEIVDCVNFAKKHNISLRVKSGGHNHAGWSTGANTLVIHLAKNVNHIEITEDASQAWIYPGSRLGNVYKRLQKENKTIPGGVCKFVNVGGLTQGGGWGLSVRKLGLTIDSLVEAEVVIAGGKDEDARLVTANANKNQDLFWAIRGGGGGNFGVVTKFLFNLSPIGKKAHVFRIHWPKEHMEKVVKAWVAFHNANQHYGLSTFLRLSVPSKQLDKSPFNATEAECKLSVLMVGMFYGTKDELMCILRHQFFNVAAPECEQYRHTTFQTAQSLLMGFSDDSQLDIDYAEQAKEKKDDSYALHHGSEATETPKPHKVTSMFPKNNFGDDAIKALVKFVKTSHNFDTSVNTYISLHALGGEVGNVDNADTAFAFRQKRFLIQPQAWWDKGETAKQEREYIDWIKAARLAMKDYTKGAFVNFPDLDLEPKEYYGENFKKLTLIKGKYDPENIFNYKGSIPPKISS